MTIIVDIKETNNATPVVAKTVEQLEAKVTHRVQELREAIVAEATVTGGTGKGGLDTYVAKQPEGLTTENYIARGQYNADFAAASTLAVGDLAIEAFKADPELKVFRLDIPLPGKDHVAAKMTKSQVIGENIVYGATKASFEVYGETGVGQVRIAKDIMTTKARSLWETIAEK